jgi:hypothetical protein
MAKVSEFLTYLYGAGVFGECKKLILGKEYGILRSSIAGPEEMGPRGPGLASKRRS